MDLQQTVQFSHPRRTLSEWDVPLMSVRIEVLDEEIKVVGRATGLFLECVDQVYLITNWHVVTGLRYPEIGAVKHLGPRALRIRYKNVVVVEGGQTRIGEFVEKIVVLYDGTRPLWFQQEPNPEHAARDPSRLQIPHNIDVVALPVELNANERRFLTLNRSDINNRIPELGEKLVIVGYPHGYSVLSRTPEPIVVTRHLAAKITERPFTVLADGIGARGMSGSPVYSVNGNHFYLFGIYKGAVIAEDQLHESRINDFYASLGEIERASSAFSFIDQLTDF